MAGADIDMEGTVEQTGGLEDETLDDATVPATQDNIGGDEDEEQNNEQQDAEEADDHDNEDEKPKPNPQTHFLSYLKSPIVHLTIGSGSSATTISAHRAMLTQSPYFASRLNEPTSSTTTNLPDEDLDAMACFLQYQYTGEYFPRRLPNQPDGLEHDPSHPSIDTTGAQLLKHARVYTLAEKLGLPNLQNPRPLQDPPHQQHRDRRDRLRPLRLRPHRQRRHHHPPPCRRLLGHPQPRPAPRSRARVQGHVSRVPAVRLRRLDARAGFTRETTARAREGHR